MNDYWMTARGSTCGPIGENSGYEQHQNERDEQCLDDQED